MNNTLGVASRFRVTNNGGMKVDLVCFVLLQLNSGHNYPYHVSPDFWVLYRQQQMGTNNWKRSSLVTVFYLSTGYFGEIFNYVGINIPTKLHKHHPYRVAIEYSGHYLLANWKYWQLFKIFIFSYSHCVCALKT